MYVGHFQCGLTLPLDEDLVRIVKFYDLPLCMFTPVSISCMVGFLAPIRLLDNPFSVTLFRLLFRTQLVYDGFVCLLAQNHRKFLEGLPRKIGIQWPRKFFFVEVPESYPLRRHWTAPIGGIG